MRKVKEGETTNDILAFLTTEPERRGRRRSPEGDAGDPDNAGQSGDLDEGPSGRSPEATAASS